MHADDIPHFFADRAALDPEAHVEVDVTFECTGDPREAAAHLCSEQSTAQWRRVGRDEDLRPRFAAKVVAFDAAARPHGFSTELPAAPRGPVHAVRATIAHPHANFGTRIPTLLSAVAGEGAFYAPAIPILRVEDLRFPERWLADFAGPNLGLAGIRAQLGVHDRPVFLGVIKPNLGIPPDEFAALGEAALRGGLDIAKDDEMLCDTTWSPLAARAAAMGAARARVAAATGTPKGYMAGITDEVARLAELHDVAVAAGATAVLVNAVPVGLSGVRLLCERARVPVFTHFPCIAAFSRVPWHGIHARVMVKLQRLAGADAVIMPGFGPRMFTPEDEVLACVQACLEPMGSLKASLPCPGGSDSAATLAAVHRRLGHADFGFVPGRGVFGHPMGPEAGAASIRQAWDAIAAGRSVVEAAADHPELASALAHFGAP